MHFFLAIASIFPLPGSSERNISPVELARACALDQDLLSAYTIFSNALCECNPEACASKSFEEQIAFDNIYKLYLQEDGQGSLFKEKVIDTCKLHPEWHSLLFFKAALFANEGDSVSFFDTFWRAFTSYPQNPLSFKIQGSIAHRVYELSDDPMVRERKRKQSIDFFLKAFDSNPEDVSLISRIIILSGLDVSSLDERKVVVSKLVPMLIKTSKPPSRSQCFMLLDIVDQLNCQDQVRQLHSVMRKWFPQSRFLDDWEQAHGCNTHE